MRSLIQRVTQCSVYINGNTHSSIKSGMLVFLGVKHGDTDEDARYLAHRCASLRIFDDADGKMNLAVQDVNGEVLVVSQFTLYGDTRYGNRPSYTEAASPVVAEECYGQFIEHLQSILGKNRVQSGVFRAMMDVQLVNDGPVTILIESKESRS